MKFGKKIYVYGVILASSLTLLGSQALVRKADRRPLNSGQSAAPSESTEGASVDASGATTETVRALDESAAPADARVERLEHSLSTLQSLLPADRTQELEGIGRAWTSGGANPVGPELPTGTNTSADALPAPAVASTLLAAPVVEAVALPFWDPLTALPNAAAPDPLRAWLATNPLTAIVVGRSRGLAAFGGQSYTLGDELPMQLGTIERIEARAVVLVRDGVERRIPLSAFVPRASDVSASQAGQPLNPSAQAITSAGASAPLGLLEDLAKKISATPAASTAQAPPSTVPASAHEKHHP